MLQKCQRIRESNILGNLVLALALLSTVCACGFTSNSHQQILKAQRLLQDLRYQEAVHEYEKMLDYLPPSLLKNKIYFQLGEIHNLYLGNHQKAIAYFEKIIQDTPDTRWKVKAKEKLAKIYQEQLGDFAMAEKYYQQLYGFFPSLKNQDFYQLRLAFGHLEQGHLKRAEAVLKQILSSPAHRFKKEAYYYMGLVKFNSQKWQEAINFWRDYLTRENRQSEIVETKLLLANAYETMEQLQKAYDIYYSLLGEYPNHEVVRNRLKSVYRRRVERKR